MKRICTLLFVIALASAQIVKADGPKGHGFLKPTVRGTLEPVEFQQAMTVLFTKGSTDEQISEFFHKIEGFSFNTMKEVYRTSFEKRFGEDDISDAEMLQIIAKMKFREVGPEYWKDHSSMFIPKAAKGYDDMEWWNPTKDRPGEYIGSCTLNGVEKDLVTTYCANPVKERKATVKAPSVPKVETEYVYIPGSKKVIEYGADTVETTRTKVIIENNNSKFASYNNSQSYTVDMTENVQQQQQTCSCPQVQQQRQVTYTTQQEQPCGCNGRYLCQNDYQKVKEKKGFFKTTGGKILTYAAAFAGGYFLRGWVDRDHSPRVGQIYTQGPFIPINNTPVITQGPLSLFN
ncbi:MAG: hypothetical protein AAB681_01985 [Patescibacteria group bacterium]